METIAKHAQGLVYSLRCLMLSLYQKASLNALLGLFLEAQGHPLPQHTQSKSWLFRIPYANVFYEHFRTSHKAEILVNSLNAFALAY